jgi:hypothetical protein
MIIETINKNGIRLTSHHSVNSIKKHGGLNTYVWKLKQGGNKVVSVTMFPDIKEVKVR